MAFVRHSEHGKLAHHGGTFHLREPFTFVASEQWLSDYLGHANEGWRWLLSYSSNIIKVLYFEEIGDSNYQSIITSQSKVVLICAILFISFFIFYPSTFVTIGTTISLDFFQ